MKAVLLALVLCAGVFAQASTLSITARSSFAGHDGMDFHVWLNQDTVQVAWGRMEPMHLKIISYTDHRPMDGDLTVNLSNGDQITVGSGFNMEGTQPIFYVSKNKDSRIQLIPQVDVQVVK
jgi:hypothetical protein